ncbi:MAG TPA: DUF4383 domain-containing protein [Verrucomicrobiae bacterium]|nr:DUF4383 domain-containing protein [Verrucomicrobiae bacterium]
MHKKLAMIFGAIFTLVGILGFIPGVTNDNMLLGIFHVDTLHNLFHLVTGLIGLYLGTSSEGGSKSWFQIFGIIYALLTVLGFVYGEEKILGLIVNNTADTWLHLVLTAALLAVGFGMSDSGDKATA